MSAADGGLTASAKPPRSDNSETTVVPPNTGLHGDAPPLTHEEYLALPPVHHAAIRKLYVATFKQWLALAEIVGDPLSQATIRSLYAWGEKHD